jgi:hypothetical protein
MHAAAGADAADMSISSLARSDLNRPSSFFADSENGNTFGTIDKHAQTTCPIDVPLQP